MNSVDVDSTPSSYDDGPHLNPLLYLGLDPFQVIYNLLDLASRRRLSSVSKDWKNTCATFAEDREPPWAVMLTGKYSSLCTYQLIDHFRNISYRRPLPNFVDATSLVISGAGGCFIMLVSGVQYSLYNPFSGDQIKLPLFQPLHSRDPYNVALSCDPSPANITEGRCVVAVTLGGSPGILMCLCRPGDSKWQELDLSDRFVWSMAFHRGRLYGTDMPGNLIMFTSTDESSLNAQFSDLAFPDSTPDENSGFRMNYLVELDGDLLLVRRNVVGRLKDVRFQVFKVVEKQQLVRVRNLGDRMLFVGKRCSMSSSATAQLFRQRSEIFKKNCIHFFYKHKSGFHRTTYHVGRFDLNLDVCNDDVQEDHSYDFYISDSLTLWITPPI